MKDFDDIKYYKQSNYRICCEISELKYNVDRYVSKYNLNIDPDFQRGYVWTIEQKTAYIEYILNGGVSGRELYFNHPGWLNGFGGSFELVDGKQRINAICEFFDNKVPIFDGNYCQDIENPKWFIYEVFININNLSEKDVPDRYISMNNGGTIHTKDDLDIAKKIKKHRNK